MKTLDIIQYRLQNQHLIQADFNNPEAVVQWFGAVQAQDYLGGLWGVGLRMKQGTKERVEQALAMRKIVRTWPMRGTLHLVAADDVRWMLKLLTPRIIRRNASRYRELGLDAATFTKSAKLLVKALAGGKQLTREALYEVLAKGQVSPAGQRGIHILGHLAQQQVLCVGPRYNKQHTFVLLDEWIPTSKKLEGEVALAELAYRYFLSHGPATVSDFSWWTGLTATEAKMSVALVESKLRKEIIDGQTYWMSPETKLLKKHQLTAYFLPPYDEYTVGYKDRRAILDPKHAKQTGNGIFSPVVVLNGQVVGTWKRALKKDAVVLTIELLIKSTRDTKKLVETAAQQYGTFLKQPISVLFK